MTTKKPTKVQLRVEAHPKVERLERDDDRCQWVCTLKAPYRSRQGEAVLTCSALGSIEDSLKGAREWADSEVCIIPASELPDWVGHDLDVTGMDRAWVLDWLNHADQDVALQDYFLCSRGSVTGRLRQMWRQRQWEQERAERLNASNPLRQLLDECHAQGKLNPAGGLQ